MVPLARLPIFAFTDQDWCQEVQLYQRTLRHFFQDLKLYARLVLFRHAFYSTNLTD